MMMIYRPPAIVWQHTYGLTESGGCATARSPDRVVEKAGSVGRLLPALDGIGIVDPEAGAVGCR